MNPHQAPPVERPPQPGAASFIARKSELLVNSLYAGIIGGGAAVLCDWLGYRSWVTFMVWTAYTLFGKTWRSGVKMYLSFCAGILCGFLVRTLEGGLDPGIGVWSAGVAVGLAIVLLSLLEDTPPLNDVPAYFLGAIAFFATEAKPSPQIFVSMLTAAAIGLGIGWLTVVGQAVIHRRWSQRQASTTPTAGR